MAIDSMSLQLPAGVKSSGQNRIVVACGVNTITEVPLGRWNVHGQPALSEPMASRVRHGGFVVGAELADNAAFAISPAEAAAMEASERIGLAALD